MNRNKLIAKLHILLKQTGSEEFKEEIYSGYGVTTSRDLTDWQLSELIQRLEGTRMVKTGGGPQHNKASTALRSQVLAVLNRLGIREDTTKINPAQRWAELNQFVRSKNRAGKTIPQMNDEELKTLFKALRAIEDSGWRKKEVKAKEVPVVIPVPIGTPGVVN